MISGPVVEAHGGAIAGDWHAMTLGLAAGLEPSKGSDGAELIASCLGP